MPFHSSRFIVADAPEGAEQRPGGSERPKRSPRPSGRLADSSGTGGPRLLNVSSWPAPVAIVGCAVLLALIAAIDASTGPELEMAPYYFLPIILASLCFRVRGGLVVALASAVLSTWPSPVALSRLNDLPVFISNALTHTLAFTFVALVTGGLQRQRERLREQRAALQQAHGLLQDDLRAAAALQRHLLRRPLPETPGLDVAAEVRFARGVGGDFYDLRRVGHYLELCIADVSGKGPRAALISAALRTLLDEIAGQLPDPLAFLRHLNARLADDLPEEMFITMFYGRLDLNSGELQYASAGHDPPLLCRGERIESLEPTAPALGMVPDLCGCTERVTLQPGETLVLYTDGLTTARHPSGDRVGEERVAECLQEYAHSGNTRHPAELIAELIGLACSPDAAPEDDVAVIALRPQ
jgi:serine phosphatase RsbU (regulator of sigma subunit)